VNLQRDGKILVAGSTNSGSFSDFALVRYNTDGSLDNTFNGTGKVTTSIVAGSDGASCMAIQTDGKIVVGGYAVVSSEGFALARYNTDGSLDTTFNGTGKVTTAIGTGESAIASVVLQSDGRILATGSVNATTNRDFVVARYNPDGSLDGALNGTGIVMTSVGNGNVHARSIALQTDGKILVAGVTSIGLGNYFALVRYNVNGTLDTTFNSTGKVVTSVTSTGFLNDSASSVVLQSDGKILVSGYSNNGSNYDFALVRYNSDGSLDTTFNGTGKLTTSISSSSDFAGSMGLQSNGRIVVAGYVSRFANSDFAVARYNSNGSLDTSFNGTGKVTTDIGTATDDLAFGLAMQPDGNILLAGYSNSAGTYQFALVRYLGDPLPDIAVEQPVGNSLTDGVSSSDFGMALAGSDTVVKFYTIRNTGTADLTGLAVMLDGANAGDFGVGALTNTTVAPGASTFLSVNFTPGTIGARTAAMHIASNVTGAKTPFDITLTGTGLTVLENWRLTFYGTTSNTGNAADAANPYHTGVPNLAAFAVLGPNQDPAKVAAGLLPQPQVIGANYVITFSQPTGVSGVSYSAEWRADLLPGAWTPMTHNVSGTTHTFSVPIGATKQIFTRLRVSTP